MLNAKDQVDRGPLVSALKWGPGRWTVVKKRSGMRGCWFLGGDEEAFRSRFGSVLRTTYMICMYVEAEHPMHLHDGSKTYCAVVCAPHVLNSAGRV